MVRPDALLDIMGVNMRLRGALTLGSLAVAMLAATTAQAFAADDPPTSTPAIVGGHEVSSAPWAAEMNGSGCSGTIISPHWALSAWHCVEDDPTPSRYSMRIGNVRRGQGTSVPVKSLHRKFDIVLLELERDVVTTYATLADTDPPIGANVDIYGWGITCENGCGLSDVLKTARMKVNGIDNGSDGSRMVDLAQVGDGYALGGDSGGPAMLNGVQFGVLCCGNTAGDGSGTESYSSVANVKDWIKTTTGVGDGGGGTTNLALNRPTKGAASCTTSETSAKAVNGSVSGGAADKWCSGVAGTKTIEVDLGANKAVKRIVVKHAGAGGENASFNTKNFLVQTSTGGGVWSTAATVTDNTASTTTTAVTANARWIRLSISDPVARIYEFEAYTS
jgi:hypothetical protein